MSIKTRVIYGAVAIAALSGGFWFSSIQQDSIETDSRHAKEKALAAARKNFSPIQGSILTPARKISIPALTKDDGTVFTLDDLTGKWHLLFFGYTNCPDVCPVTMGAVAQAKKIATANNQLFPDVFFISVDPARDNVEMLAEYVQYFDKDFIGVTGDEKLIKALTLQMSVVYMKVESREVKPGKVLPEDVVLEKVIAEIEEKDSETSGYLVDHSSALLLLNPEGKLVAFLNPPHNSMTILKDFQTMVKQNN